MIDSYLLHGANALVGALDHLDGPSDPEKWVTGIYLSVAYRALSYLAKDAVTAERIADGLSSPRERLLLEFEDEIGRMAEPCTTMMIHARMEKRMVAYLFQDFETTLCSADQSCPEMRDLTKHIQALSDSFEKMCFEEPVNGRQRLRRAVHVLGGSAIVEACTHATDDKGRSPCDYGQIFGGCLVVKGLRG